MVIRPIQLVEALAKVATILLPQQKIVPEEAELVTMEEVVALIVAVIHLVLVEVVVALVT